LDDSQIKFRRNCRGHVFTPKDLSNPSLSRACLPELGTDSLGVIVVLGHHPSEILINLNPLKYIAVDRELLAEGQCCCYCRLPLLPSLYPDLALFRQLMARVEGVDLHATTFTPVKSALLRDFNKIHWMDVAEMSPHHPPILELPGTSWVWTLQSSGVQLSAYHVEDRGLVL